MIQRLSPLSKTAYLSEESPLKAITNLKASLTLVKPKRRNSKK